MTLPCHRGWVIFTVSVVLAGHSSVHAGKAHICMITAYREHPYVQETSDAILEQLASLPSPSDVSLSIIVASSGLSQAWIDSPFAQIMHDREIANGTDCETNQDTDPLPSYRVRQQGLDVANALESCHSSHPSVDWIILLEDDFLPCKDALPRLLQILQAMDPSSTKFARFTQGSGGVAFPTANVPLYVQDVRKNIRDKPYDHVLLEPWSSQPDVVLPIHLFLHVGRVSTIERRNTPEYRQEFAAIRDNACGDAITI